MFQDARKKINSIKSVEKRVASTSQMISTSCAFVNVKTQVLRSQCQCVKNNDKRLALDLEIGNLPQSRSRDSLERIIAIIRNNCDTLRIRRTKMTHECHARAISLRNVVGKCRLNKKKQHYTLFPRLAGSAGTLIVAERTRKSEAGTRLRLRKEKNAVIQP